MKYRLGGDSRPRLSRRAKLGSSDVAMAAIEEKRETGASLIFLGLAVWVVDFLVLFFLPSGIKLGRQGTFLNIILALGVLGLALLIIGLRARGKSSAD